MKNKRPHHSYIYQRSKSFNPDQLGQSITELAILVVVIVFALIGMQTYLKRGIQGRVRANVDNIGEQYDPERTVSDTNVTLTSSSTTYTNAYRDVVQDAGGAGQDRTLVRVTEVIATDGATSSYEMVDAP